MTESIDTGIALAREGVVPGLQRWLGDGNDPNRHDGNGWTPLLWAAARGHHEVVGLLLADPDRPADPDLGHAESGALAIHMAGHSGSVRSAALLLDHRPEHLDAVWDLNGHTILLQTVFYGHLALAEFVLKRGASTAITTARGLGPRELAAQFQNRRMVELISPFDSPSEAKAAYYESYLRRIAPEIPAGEAAQQELAERLGRTIAEAIQRAATDPSVVDTALTEVAELVESGGADVNRLAGPLQQPPLIVAVTGNNGFPPNADVARFRERVADYLLEHGADPTRHEQHPMGAQTIIRAAVFNHLAILRACGRHLSAQQLADAINEYPVVNGLTAMHDTVLRATMAAPEQFEGYLEQTRWFIENGGRTDIEDFAGRTQRAIAENAADPEKRRRLLEVMDAAPSRG